MAPMMPIESLIRRTKGLDGPDGELEKLTIRVESSSGKFEKEIKAQFNPDQITLAKTAKWSLKSKSDSDTGEAQFTHGEPATLDMDLFFDSYEAGTDVRDHTRKIFSLVTIQGHGDLHRPPLCKLQWGGFNISDEYGCAWVLTSLTQKLDLFLPSGLPVRATLTCKFQQWRGDEIEAKLLKKESADVAKTRVVRRGDTLTSIAGEEYDDPALWRAIATANGIDNPRQIPPGTVLTIPELS